MAIPRIACRVWKWLARRYHVAHEDCSRSKARRFGLPLALGLFTLFVVMMKASGLAERWGIIIRG